MFTIVKSETFARWFAKLKNHEAQLRILARLRMMSEGHFGDSKPLTQGIR